MSKGEVFENLYMEFSKAVSSYFRVQFATPEELYSALKGMELSCGDKIFCRWLESIGFPVFQKLLVSGEDNPAIALEFTMLQALTDDFVKRDDNIRMDLRAYLMNLISYLPYLVKSNEVTN